MAFRYTNAGDGADLLVSVTALDVDKTKSLTGKAFYGGNNKAAYLTVPEGLKEVWFKFDLYIDSAAAKGDRFSFGHYSSSLGGYFGIWNDASTPAKILCDARPKAAINTGLTGTLGAINKIFLHMVSDATDGLIELTVNGASYTYTGNVNNGADFDTLYFYSSGANMLFSNIIVADTEVHPYEGANSTSFDVETHIYNGLRGWRYFNPGDADLLAITGATQVYTGLNQSVTGKTFYGGAKTDMINTPSDLSEFWLRCDFWLPSSNNYDHIYIGHFGANVDGVIGMFWGYETGWVVHLQNGRNQYVTCYGNRSALNHMLLHVKSGELIEMSLNGNSFSWRGNVNNGDPVNNIALFGTTKNTLISNVVVSSNAIDINSGFHRDLFTAETEVTAPVLNVRWQGANHQFYPTTKRTTPALTLRVGDKNFYAPIVNNDDALASAVKLLLDDTTRAITN